MDEPDTDTPCRSMGGGIFLTDGGMETTLIFHEGVELPHFAAFVLLDSADGRATLQALLRRLSCGRARDHGLGFVLESPTWRANPDWGAQLGYAAAALDAVNRAVDRVSGGVARRVGSGRRALRHQRRHRPARRRLPGRQHGRRRGRSLSRARRSRPLPKAAPTWSPPITLTYVEEAIGIARAAQREGMPSRSRSPSRPMAAS